MSCSICSTPADKVLVSTEIAMAVPHPDPLTRGHTLVVSRRHVSEFFELDVEEQQIMWQIVRLVQNTLTAQTGVDQFSIGFADFPAHSDSHAHIHVLPRRTGDQFKLPEGIDWVG
jgi:diadenosine tetraphosphate (Ap4A) HIT family hydrolase